MSVWTESVVERLKTLHEAGFSASDIVAALAAEGVALSRNAVLGKIFRLRAAQSCAARPARRVEGACLPPASSPPPRLTPRAAPQRHAGGDLVVFAKPQACGKSEALLGALAASIEPVSLVAVEAGLCRYPVRGEGLALMVCGAPARAGSSYCPRCHRLAYDPARRPLRPPAEPSTRRATREPREGDLVDEIGEAA